MTRVLEAAPLVRREVPAAELVGIVVLLTVQIAIAVAAINAPFTEPAAYGRSCINATEARNFFEHGFRILFPQLDYGPPPGYASLEFPLVPYLAALLYPIVGIQDWVGRAIPAAFGLATTVVVWRISARICQTAAARVAAVAVVVLSPMFEFFSRVFQSDSAMVFFISLSVWLLLRGADTAASNRRRSSAWFAAACVACAAGMLLKPSSLVLLPALCWIAWTGDRTTLMRPVALVLVPLVSVAVYYAHVHAINSYPATLGLAVVARRATLAHILQFRYEFQVAKDVIQAATPFGVIAIAFGVFQSVRNERLRFLTLWVAGAAVLDVVYNEALSHHEYYQMIWTPAAALFAGAAVDAWAAARLRGSARFVAAAGVLVLAMLSVAVCAQFLTRRLVVPRYAVERLDGGLLARDVTPPDALIAVEDIDVLYYAHRRGWIYYTDPVEGQLVRTRDIQQISDRGARYLVSTSRTDIFSADALAFLHSQASIVGQRGPTIVWRLPPE